MFHRTLIFLCIIFFRWRIKVEGLKNLPRNRGFIIASNHVSSFDQFIITAAMKRFFWEVFLKKRKKFYWIGESKIKKRWYSWFLKEKHGYIVSTKKGINRAAKLLEQGNIIGIFPEGHRNNKEKLSKGKRGIAYMALPTEAVVIPTYCSSYPTFSFVQGLKNLINPKKIFKVSFGPQISFVPRSISYILKNRATSELATDIIMLEIAKLGRRDYQFDEV